MASKRLSKDETEQLIELVRQKPYLHDVTDPNHADATKVERTTMLSENHVLFGGKKLLKRAKLTLYPRRSPALYKWFRARQRTAKRPR